MLQVPVPESMAVHIFILFFCLKSRKSVQKVSLFKQSLWMAKVKISHYFFGLVYLTGEEFVFCWGDSKSCAF